MLKFNQYITEASKEGHGLHVFDVDDTLFHTTAKVNVMHGPKKVAALSNSEYNTHKLEPGHRYDYSEFNSSDKFDSESTPMPKMLNKLKAIHGNVKKTHGSKVIINTARADFDNKNKFLDTFRKHGVDIDDIHVHRAGNRKEPGSVAERKANVVRDQLKSGKFKRATLYDDSKENLNHFLKLKHEHPDVTFKAYHVQHNGSVVRHRE